MAMSTWPGPSLVITSSESLDLLSLWVESLPLKLSWQCQSKCDRKAHMHGEGGLA